MLKIIQSRFTSRTDDGFSLMEIMLVLSIIAVLSTISAPSMRGFAASRRLKTSARTITDTLSFARDMAITERTTHLVVFDITNNRFWLASSETFDIQNPAASQGRATTASTGQRAAVSRTGGVMGIPKSLGQGVTLLALTTSHNGPTQQITSGVDYVYFTPISTSADTVIFLQNVRENMISITVEAATGRASVQPMSPEQIQTLGLGKSL
jgi:prepilin-type N-terminal cleavage/methylation domain-containing protein